MTGCTWIPHNRKLRQALRGWVAGSGATLREGPHLEVYLDTPDETAEQDLLTALMIAIE